MDLLKKFKELITEQNLIHKNDKILIAVSGGVDSVVLLHLFYCIKDEFNLMLKIIHLNHGIRGKEADRDETFVRQLAHQYSIPITTKKIDVIEFVQSHKCSLEEGARIKRYQFFKEELEKSKFSCLALGHNANDQAETILDHILRGSGIRGLSGMRHFRNQLIRPLLTFTRKDIETYAYKMSLNYVIDITNMQIKYKRNKIRHQLIPYLQQEFNPKIVNIILKTGAIIGEIDNFLKAEAQQAYRKCLKSFEKNKIILDINHFFNYFNIIQIYVLYHILNLLSIEENILNFNKIITFLKFIERRKIGTRFSLINQWEILIDHNAVVLQQIETTDFEFKIIPNKSYTVFGGRKIFSTEIITIDQLPKRFSGTKNIEYIDFDKINEPLILRNFRAGDRFVPLNMKGHKKVSDFFTDTKVPLHLRREIPLLTCSENIIWVVGYQIDDQYKITPASRNILRMEFKEALDDS